ncbi:epoxide hydrolase 1 [Sphingomonas sp. SUN019]|uniref:epoxide hydrolase family protein n=1 Tax=Sphingomonas sp. SUN019 TaxID=2937788 RepID=UPI0021645D44|nr:epoxide hydrolase family protein [Sphingomonas sp. SUN019]UVO48994.1 epoxide hydrolase 1 [Sphingomonas sp. SUN019]
MGNAGGERAIDIGSENERMSSETIEPFRIAIDEAVLDDLRRRLRATRWPERETVDGWGQGVPLEQARRLVDHWLTAYDWRRCEALLDGFGQYRTKIDGLGIHFLHRCSPEPGALPLILTHGWPGSVIEFHKVIDALADPVAHGGRAEDAFHVVAPSLPGYGFSDKPGEAGWGVERIARAWAVLMRRLGYDRYVAQGGDWGSAVTTALAQIGDPAVAGIHLNMIVAPPSAEDIASATEAEKVTLAALQCYQTDGNGYAQQQRTRPQTLGYGLADSPVGQAMWIFEKFHEWTDCDGDPFSVLSADEMLDNVMLYWLTNSGASSARLYWESFRSFASGTVDVPIACSLFPKEIFPPSRRWADKRYRNIVYWNELSKGGHFAAFEQPELFVEELRKGFRGMR